MPDSRRQLGQWGEELAASHLERLGYNIVQRNYRCRLGEVDIIAQDGARLAFVEVRTRRGDAYGTAKESVTPAKQERLAAVARQYLSENCHADVDWGIDVVAIQLTGHNVVRRIELIRNAVSESG